MFGFGVSPRRRASKRSPDERSDIRVCSVVPHIATLMRATRYCSCNILARPRIVVCMLRSFHEGAQRTQAKDVLMMRIALVAVFALALGGSGTSFAQQLPDSRVADLAQSAALRVGLGLGSLTTAIKDPATGEVKGPALELGRALAARIGVQFVAVEYPRPGAVINGLSGNAWDISILIIDPVRAEQVDFSNPFLQSDLTYLVAAGSTIQSVADADQSGIRIAAPRGDTSDLLLNRALNRAELVRTDNIAAAIELLRTGGVDAIALNRPSLIAQSATLPSSIVLSDGFANFYSAVAVPKGHVGGLRTSTSSLRTRKPLAS